MGDVGDQGIRPRVLSMHTTHVRAGPLPNDICIASAMQINAVFEKMNAGAA